MRLFRLVVAMVGGVGVLQGEDSPVPACCANIPNRNALAAATVAGSENSESAPKTDRSHEGMVWIEGGTFKMGSESGFPDESPVHEVTVDGFWMDATEVTNRQFREFVEATGYVTTAEIAPKLEDIMKQVPPGTPPPPKEMLVPGSVVFRQPPTVHNLQDVSQWWTWQPGANWRHPTGPDSSIEGKDDYPVVQVSYEDALAYAKWAGKRLPTEAEWEYAARGGLVGKPYVWGDAPIDPTSEKQPANTWQGQFPVKDTAKDGFAGLAPVKQFPPNNYGLYDMAGNVWEWCSDWYRPDTYRAEGRSGIRNPQGPDSSYDPQEPHAMKRVVRGGSFLCNDSYCSGFRPSARMKESFDTSTNHIGFRCVSN